jgi:hypothetical protein
MRSQHVENWFPFVKDFTFKTYFLPLSPQVQLSLFLHSFISISLLLILIFTTNQDARAIVDFYHMEYNNRGKITEEQKMLLKNLENSIDALLKPLRDEVRRCSFFFILQ